MISEEYPGRISSRCKKYPPFREKAGQSVDKPQFCIKQNWGLF